MLNGIKRIPKRPSIAIVPNSLSNQWAAEIERFTAKGAFRVLKYFGGEKTRRAFWAPGGVWEQEVINAPHPHRIIIVADMTVSGIFGFYKG
jgi:hypothetical protein